MKKIGVTLSVSFADSSPKGGACPLPLGEVAQRKL